MRSCFKINLIFIKLSNVKFLCLKPGVFLVTDTNIRPGFQDSYCLNPQPALCKRLTLSTASTFVTEGLFIYIYFLLSEENHQNRISRAGEKNSPTILLFFRKMILKYKSLAVLNGLRIEHLC